MTPAVRRASVGRQVGRVALVAAGVLVLDQVSKVIAVATLEGHEIDLTVVRLTVTRNSGAAFSLLRGQVWLFMAVAAGVTVIVLVALRRPQSTAMTLGLGMVLGGAWGNVIDRFARAPGAPRGGVVDFIDFKIWPVFNVADAAIVVGAAVLVLFGGRRSTDESSA